MTTPSDKQKLYKQIVQWGDKHMILARMRELGFWPAGEPLPGDPPDEASERQQLEAALKQLRQKHAKVKDPNAALAEERKRRWDESKARRAANKKQRIEDAQRRREAWAKARPLRISHLGVGVSHGLDDRKKLPEGAESPERGARESDAERLTACGLPVIHTGAELAKAMTIPLPTLKWLSYHRRGAALVHYSRYGIPKKTGGVRLISAPKPKLAAAQRWIFEQVLTPLDTGPHAHGFVKTRSILTNAEQHIGKNVVVNMDVKDFFPTFTFRRVKGLFHTIGYSEHVSTVLALLTTEPPRVPAEFDGKRYWVALGERRLPQGACTSPAITNLICTRLDKRLAGLATSLGFAYTRYADDLTFSGDDRGQVGTLLATVRGILKDSGLTEHPDKTRVMHRGRRQEVTGLVVNTKASVPRKELRRLRAILHNCGKWGLASQNKTDHPDFAAHLAGKVAFVMMVDPAKGQQLLPALERALQKP